MRFLVVTQHGRALSIASARGSSLTNFMYAATASHNQCAFGSGITAATSASSDTSADATRASPVQYPASSPAASRASLARAAILSAPGAVIRARDARHRARADQQADAQIIRRELGCPDPGKPAGERAEARGFEPRMAAKPNRISSAAP